MLFTLTLAPPAAAQVAPSRTIDTALTDGVEENRANATITLASPGSITLGRRSSSVEAIDMRGANATFTMTGGDIRLGDDRVSERGVNMTGATATVDISGGAITLGGGGDVGIRLGGIGAHNQATPANSTHTLTLSDGARIESTQADANGIRVLDLGTGNNSHVTLNLDGGVINLTGAGSKGVWIQDDHGAVTINVSNEITASGSNSYAIDNTGNLPLVLNLLAGADINGAIRGGTGADTFNINTDHTGVLTTGAGANIVNINAGAHLTLNAGSTLSSDGDDNPAVQLTGASPQLTLQGGTISTSGDDAWAISASPSAPANASQRNTRIRLNGGQITTTGMNAHGVVLFGAGPAGNGNIHRLEIAAGHSINASGYGVYIPSHDPDNDASTDPNYDKAAHNSKLELDLGGAITANTGLQIGDSGSGATVDNEIEVTISGVLTGIIEAFAARNLTLKLEQGADIQGSYINLGQGDDTITISGVDNPATPENEAPRVAGRIFLNDGDDTVTLSGEARVNGLIGGSASSGHHRRITLNDDARVGNDPAVDALTGGGAARFTVTLNNNALVNGGIFGASGIDVITLNNNARVAGNIFANNGDDLINLNGAATIEGYLDGGGGDDHLNYSGRSGAVTVALSGSRFGFNAASATGITGTSINNNAFFSIEQLTGSAQTDSLTGYDTDAVWTLQAAPANATYLAEGNTLTFTGFETLTGGAGVDTFTLSSAYSANLNGGAGNDVFTLSNGADLTGNITTGAGNDVFTLSDGANLTGALTTGGGNDTVTLTGNALQLDRASFDTGTGTDTLILAGNILVNAAQFANFSGYENLTLNDTAQIATNIELFGDVANTLTLAGAATIGGYLDTSRGADHLDYTGRTGAVTVTLSGSDDKGFSASGASGLTGGNIAGTNYAFLGVDRLTGSGQTDTLTGYDTDAVWTLQAAASTYVAGGNTLTFNSFENLTGGTGPDTFNLSSAHSGNLDGGAGNDVFTLSNGADLTGNLIGGMGNDTFTLSGDAQLTGNLSGGDGDDQVNLSDTAQVDGDINTGAGDDTVILADSAYVSGIIDGGEHNTGDTLNVTNLAKGAAAGVIDYRNFETVTGLPNAAVAEQGAVAPPQPPVDGGDQDGGQPDGGDQQPGPVQPGGQPDGGDQQGAGQQPAPVQPGGQQPGAGQPPAPDTGTETGTDTDSPPPAPVAPPATPDTPVTARVDPNNPSRFLIPLPGGGTGGSDRLVIVDRAAESAQATATGVLSSAVHQVINQRLTGGAAPRRSSGPTRSQRRPVQVAAHHLPAGLLATEAGPVIWGQVFAAERQRAPDGAVSGHTQRYRGVAFGAEQSYGGALAGLLFGYANADLASHAKTTRIDSDSLVLGAYGQVDWHGLNVGGSLTFGYEDHDRTRTLINRGVRQQAEGRYDSLFLSPALRLSYPLALTDQWELRPEASVNYTLGWYDGYTERGAGDVNLTQGKRQGKSWQTRLGLDLAHRLPEDAGEVVFRTGLDSRFTRHGAGTFRLGGNTFQPPVSSDRSVHTAFVGAALRVRLNQRLNLEADVEYQHDAGEVGERALSGSLLLSYAF